VALTMRSRSRPGLVAPVLTGMLLWCVPTLGSVAHAWSDAPLCDFPHGHEARDDESDDALGMCAPHAPHLVRSSSFDTCAEASGRTSPDDAPALATATIGIAMGAAGTDVAMETADVVLMSDNLRNIPFAISISRHARTVIWQNLAIAMSVIIVLVASALGFSLPLTLGVVGHEGSTVLVCLNGLRLLAFRPKENSE